MFSTDDSTINPKSILKEKDKKNLMLSSMIIEKLALVQLMNVESEMLKKVIEKNTSTKDLIAVNESIEKILQYSVRKEKLLYMNMCKILTKIDDDSCCCEE